MLINTYKMNKSYEEEVTEENLFSTIYDIAKKDKFSIFRVLLDGRELDPSKLHYKWIKKALQENRTINILEDGIAYKIEKSRRR